MSERALAHFLHALLEPRRNGTMGMVAASGVVVSAATLERLAADPAHALRALLSAHTDALLATWPGGAALRPATLPASALLVGAALTNMARAATHPSPRLLPITERLVDTLPAAATRDAALAYHSLLRHIEHVPIPHENWQTVVRALLHRSPLTAAWLPRLSPPGTDLPLPRASDDPLWPLLAGLLRDPLVEAPLHDRWLALLPPPDALAAQGVSIAQAKANVLLGQLLDEVYAPDGAADNHALLRFYEADCMLQRHGSREDASWPLLRWLASALHSGDELEWRKAHNVLARYRALHPLLEYPPLLRRYAHLDGRFCAELGALLRKGKPVWMTRERKG